MIQTNTNSLAKQERLRLKEFLYKKPLMEEMGVKAQKLKDELLYLVDEDTNAFNGILSAMRLSASSDKEKNFRKLSILKANRYAIEIPFKTAETSYEILKIVKNMVKEGNPNSVSDAGVSGEMALAAVRGACMNIQINLSGFSGDDAFAEKMETESNIIITKSEKIYKQIYSDVREILNNL